MHCKPHSSRTTHITPQRAQAERLSKVREAKAQRRADLGSLEDQVRRTHRRVLELGQLEAEEAARAEKACVEGQKTAAVYENRRKRKRDEMPAVRQQQDAELGSLRARDAALRAVRSEADERRDHAEQQVLNLQTLHTQAQTQQDELEDQVCTAHGKQHTKKYDKIRQNVCVFVLFFCS